MTETTATETGLPGLLPAAMFAGEVVSIIELGRRLHGHPGGESCSTCELTGAATLHAAAQRRLAAAHRRQRIARVA